MDIFDELNTEPKSDIFDELSTEISSPKDVGEIRALNPTIMGEIKNKLISGGFGNLFLRNQPDIENEKRRQALASFVNTATLGVPQAITQYGLKGNLAPVKAPTQDVFGGLAGSTVPFGIAGVASRVVPGSGMWSRVGQAATMGGVGGVLLPGTIEERKKAGAWGAGIAGTVSFVSSIAPKLINLGGRKTAQAIAEKADKGINKVSEELGKKYETMFSNVKGTSPVDDVLQSVDEVIDQYPEGAGMGKLKSISTRLKEMKEAGKEISAKELHNLKQEIGKTIPKSVWNGVSDGDALTNAREGVYWRITDKLEQLGGDEYKGLTQEYRLFKQSERLARKLFYQEGVPTNPSMGNSVFGYTIPRQRAVRYLSSKLPETERFANNFEAWRRGNILKGGAVGGTGMYMLHRYLTDLALRRE